MNSQQERTLQAFRRMQGWLGARPELTAGSSSATDAPLAQQIAALGVVIQQFTTHAAQQNAAARAKKGSTAEASNLRVELVKHHMVPIADMAKAAIPDIVRMTEQLRMAAARFTTEGLIAAAEAMAKAGDQEENRTKLIQGGLPADFVKQLRGVAAAYRAAIDTRGQHVANRKGAAEGIVATIDEGRKLVISISVILNRLLRADSVALAEWNQLRRVTLKGVRATGAPRLVPAPAVTTPEVTQPSPEAAQKAA